MSGKVERNSVIGDVLDSYPDAAHFFTEMGMQCLGCPAARGETVEEACEVHRVDCTELLARINRFIQQEQTI